MNDTATQCKRIIDYIRANGYIRNRTMSREQRIHEARLLVLAYMQAEDVSKAQEALDKWVEEVKGVDDVNYSDKT